MEIVTPDLCIVGGGSGGLVVAAVAAQLGLRVVLVERDRMGGDCLNVGCVPSKALLAAARAAQAHRQGAPFGIDPVEPRVHFDRVMDHVASVIRSIAPNDSVERFEGLGVRVIQAEARFVGRRELDAGGCRIRSRRIVLATGSRPSLPPIPGLAEAPHFTNDTIFANRTLPRHLVVIGGGPVGLELGQAHRRLGARVTVLEADRFLAHDEPELAEVVVRRLCEEGVDLRASARIARIEASASGATVLLEDGERLDASHLLVAAGRAPNLEALALDVAGVAHTPRGITVGPSLRTSNRHVWAIGDCNGLYPFTHMAGYEAGLFIRGALFRAPARLDHGIVPWTTYTDPELAHVGLTEHQARQRHGERVRVVRWSLTENDRARAEAEAHGEVKAVVDRRGRILGASIVARGAGELIQPWCLAVSQGLKIAALANFVPPYPTLGEASKRAAGSFYSDALFAPRTRRVVRWLLRLPVW
ncbi:MAG: FAD-dependent oxidoreductase [Reyranellaceae bacterium]